MSLKYEFTMSLPRTSGEGEGGGREQERRESERERGRAQERGRESERARESERERGIESAREAEGGRDRERFASQQTAHRDSSLRSFLVGLVPRRAGIPRSKKTAPPTIGPP